VLSADYNIKEQDQCRYQTGPIVAEEIAPGKQPLLSCARAMDTALMFAIAFGAGCVTGLVAYYLWSRYQRRKRFKSRE